jgi:hypothetical protein
MSPARSITKPEPSARCVCVAVPNGLPKNGSFCCDTRIVVSMCTTPGADER